MKWGFIWEICGTRVNFAVTETSFKDIFMAILVMWLKTLNYSLLWLKNKVCPHFTCWWSGNASRVECVIAFCGECSKLFPIFSTFSSVSTYFLAAFLSSRDPEKFSVKFFSGILQQNYYSNKVFNSMFVSIHSYRNRHTYYAGWRYFIIVSSQTAKTEHTPMGAWMILVFRLNHM